MGSLEKRDLGEIALSLLGIFFVVRAISQASSLTEILLSEYGSEQALPFLLPFAVYLVGGLFLLVFRRRLSLELFGSNGDQKRNVVVSNDFLVSLLGLWFLANGVVEAATTESQTMLYPSAVLEESLFGGGQSQALITREAWLARIPYAANLLVGLALFASSGRIVELWTRMRRAGRVH